MTLIQSAMTLKDLSSVLASQGIRGTELTVQVIINFNFNFISFTFSLQLHDSFQPRIGEPNRGGGRDTQT